MIRGLGAVCFSFYLVTGLFCSDDGVPRGYLYEECHKVLVSHARKIVNSNGDLICNGCAECEWLNRKEISLILRDVCKVTFFSQALISERQFQLVCIALKNETLSIEDLIVGMSVFFLIYCRKDLRGGDRNRGQWMKVLEALLACSARPDVVKEQCSIDFLCLWVIFAHRCGVYGSHKSRIFVDVRVRELCNSSNDDRLLPGSPLDWDGISPLDLELGGASPLDLDLDGRSSQTAQLSFDPWQGDAAENGRKRRAIDDGNEYSVVVIPVALSGISSLAKECLPGLGEVDAAAHGRKRKTIDSDLLPSSGSVLLDRYLTVLSSHYARGSAEPGTCVKNLFEHCECGCVSVCEKNREGGCQAVRCGTLKFVFERGRLLKNNASLLEYLTSFVVRFERYGLAGFNEVTQDSRNKCDQHAGRILNLLEQCYRDESNLTIKEGFKLLYFLYSHCMRSYPEVFKTAFTDVEMFDTE